MIIVFQAFNIFQVYQYMYFTIYREYFFFY